MSRWYIGTDTGSKVLAHYAKGASAKDHKWVSRSLKNGHWVYVYDSQGKSVGSNSAGSSTPSMDEELTSRGYKKDADGIWKKYDSSGNVVDSFNPKGGNYKNPHSISGSVPENWRQTRYQRDEADEARRASAANRANQSSSMNSQAETERNKAREIAERRAAENRAQSTSNSMSSQEATARSSKYNAIKRGNESERAREQEAITKRSPSLERAKQQTLARKLKATQKEAQENARAQVESERRFRIGREAYKRELEQEKRAQDTSNSMSSQEATARSSKYNAVKRGNESERARVMKPSALGTPTLNGEAARAIEETLKRAERSGMSNKELEKLYRRLGLNRSSGTHHF